MTARKPAETGADAVVEAARVADAALDPTRFAYAIVVEAEPRGPLSGDDRRVVPRRRTRLRSGKIFDQHGRFVTACLVHDLSAKGTRLRLPAGLVLPATCHLFDDQSGQLSQATIAWQRAGEAGLRLRALDGDGRAHLMATTLRPG